MQLTQINFTVVGIKKQLLDAAVKETSGDLILTDTTNVTTFNKRATTLQSKEIRAV